VFLWALASDNFFALVMQCQQGMYYSPVSIWSQVGILLRKELSWFSAQRLPLTVVEKILVSPQIRLVTGVCACDQCVLLLICELVKD